VVPFNLGVEAPFMRKFKVPFIVDFEAHIMQDIEVPFITNIEVHFMQDIEVTFKGPIEIIKSKEAIALNVDFSIIRVIKNKLGLVNFD
jgi:hypothetical protein